MSLLLGFRTAIVKASGRNPHREEFLTAY